MATLTVSTANPRYFDNGSGPVYLAGWYDNFSPQSGGDWALVKSTISTHGLNVCRLWVRHHEERTPYSYTKTGATYDLDTPNPAYLTVLRSACEDLAALNCYAIVMLWQGWSLHDNGWGNKFLTCPYRSTMNSELPPVNGDWYNSDGYGTEVDEVRSAGNANEIAIRAKQRIWIRAVVDRLNDLDNIIWEVSNEDRFNTANQEWCEWVASEIRDYEDTLAKQHPVGMSSTYDGTTSVNPWLKSTTADWIAPNDAAGEYASTPEVNTGFGVVINDVDHIVLGYGGAVPNVSADWVWKTALRGHQPLQIYPRVEDANMLASLGQSITYMNALTLASLTPTSDTAACSTGYCQRWQGREYLAYQPGTGAFTMGLLEGHYTYEWFNVTTGLVSTTGTITATTGSNTLTPPFAGPAVLKLVRATSTVAYSTGMFAWTYVHGAGALPSEFRLRRTLTPSTYSTDYVTAGPSERQKAVLNVVPSAGTYYAKVWSYHSTSGEYASGTELLFTATGGAPMGVLTLQHA